MQIKRIPFPQVPQLSSKDVAYAEQDPALRPFFKYEVNLEAFSQVIEDKKKDAIDRNTLVKVLKSQYAQLETTEIIEKNIEALLDKETFTVTTAHQPSLFTGPLYFIYKIISTLNLAGQLNRRYPNQYFVPVFITGGEDHDFEEINHANLFNKTIIWENEESGAVGQMKTSSLSSALAELKEILAECRSIQEKNTLI